MIDNLLNEIKNGARTNRFRVTIPLASNNSRSYDISTISTSIPGRTINTAEVFVKGRKVPVRGETNLENTWDIQFYNDENLKFRHDIMKWMEEIHNNKYAVNMAGTAKNIISGIRNLGESFKNVLNNPLGMMDAGTIDYQKDIIIEQLDTNNNTTYKYTLIGAFPINIGNIELDGTNPDISRSSVTFTFSDIKTGNNSEFNISDLEKWIM